MKLCPISRNLISSFHQCVDEVAKERAYLATLEAPSLEALEYALQNQIEGVFPLLLAVDTERVIGWCSIARNCREGFLHVGVLGIGVLNEFRGMGIGRRLLVATLEKARQMGMIRIELEVFATNHRAVRFYTREAFEVEGTKKRARCLDGCFEDIVCMARFV